MLEDSVKLPEPSKLEEIMADSDFSDAVAINALVMLYFLIFHW